MGDSLTHKNHDINCGFLDIYEKLQAEGKNENNNNLGLKWSLNTKGLHQSNKIVRTIKNTHGYECEVNIKYCILKF